MSDEGPEVTIHLTGELQPETARALGEMIGRAVEWVERGKPPPTPQLDQVSTLKDRSEQIGQFVAEYLPQQGIVLGRWVWVRYPCPFEWTRKNGELIHAGILVSEENLVQIEAFDCPCPPTGGAPGPHERFELHPIIVSDRWVNDTLARFFGLDPDVMETERRALLEWVRAKADREATRGNTPAERTD
jgi:hypothetical protein